MNELIKELQDIDWMACQAMKEWDGVDIARVPKEFHGYRAILAKVSGLIDMLSRHETAKAVPSESEDKRLNCVHRANVPLKSQARVCQKKFGIDSSPCPDDADETCTVPCHPTPSTTEPLAVLADRKGAGYMTIFYPWSHNQAGWCIRFSKTAFMFEGPTYAAAEAKAKAWLTALPDVKEGK